MNDHRCAVCAIPAAQCCAGCRVVFYCNRDHQKRHWKEGHKAQCAPYKIVTTERLGRHMVATRDIAERDVILVEAPLVTGPKTMCFPTCLVCLKLLKPDENDQYYSCEKCGWPMCSQACSSLPVHRDECKLMQDNGYWCDIEDKKSDKKNHLYSYILPLRCILLKNKSKNKYDALINLQSHLKERLNLPTYKLHKTKLIPFIKDALKLELDENKILEIVAIIDTNAFEIRRGSDLKIRGIYPTAALLSHDCVTNTKHSFVGEDYQIVLTATKPIAKGEIIKTTYTHTLWNTLSRQNHLKLAKCFNCDCKRCSDKTELGTYLGSIYCSVCKKRDEIDCPKVVSINPLDMAASWKCEQCDKTIPSKQMQWGNNAMRDEIMRLNKSKPDSLEDFLKKYSETLHPKNCHVLEVKYALSQMYGNIPGYMLSEISDELLERKLDLCHELLEIADVLEGGSSRFRGLLLYDLQAAMVMKAKWDFNNEKITKSAAQETMVESLTILQEAAEILKIEPEMKVLLQDKLSNLASELEFE